LSKSGIGKVDGIDTSSDVVELANKLGKGSLVFENKYIGDVQD